MQILKHAERKHGKDGGHLDIADAKWDVAYMMTKLERGDDALRMCREILIIYEKLESHQTAASTHSPIGMRIVTLCR